LLNQIGVFDEENGKMRRSSRWKEADTRGKTLGVDPEVSGTHPKSPVVSQKSSRSQGGQAAAVAAQSPQATSQGPLNSTAANQNSSPHDREQPAAASIQAVSRPVKFQQQTQLSIKNRLFLKEDELQWLLLNRGRPHTKLSVQNPRTHHPVLKVG
jgi:hypothetical protein